MVERTIRLVPLTEAAEEGVRAYIIECEEYAKKHPYKTKVTEQLKKRLGTSEEYFEDPLYISVTITKNVNIAQHQQQIELKLEKLMQRYGVPASDYVIEVE